MASNAKVHAIFGPTNSGESLATTPIFARFKMPSLGSASSISLIDPGEISPTPSALSPQQRAVGRRRPPLPPRRPEGEEGRGASATTPATAPRRPPTRSPTSRRPAPRSSTDAVIDANAQDMSPDMLRARDAGARRSPCWSDIDRPGCPADERARADRLGRCHCRAIPPWARATSPHLLEKPEYWDKVYIVGYRSCSYDANGKLPPRTAGVRRRGEGQGRVAGHLAVVGDRRRRCGARWSPRRCSKTGSSDSDAIIGYWNSLTNWPGLFGDYTFTPERAQRLPDRSGHVGRPTQRRRRLATWRPATPEPDASADV